MRPTLQIVILTLIAALLSATQSSAAIAAPAPIFHVQGVQCVRPLRPLFFTPDPDKEPVLIVGGTAAVELVYTPLELRLMNDEYEAYFFQLHQNGLIDMRTNADYLAKCVDAVLADTGKAKVHLIGHSQGGLVARSYMHRHTATKVDSLISLASPHRGTEVAAASDPKAAASEEAKVKAIVANLLLSPVTILTPMNELKLLLEQFSPGSSFLAELDAKLPAQVHFTNFSTTQDLFVHPWQNGQMPSSACDETDAQGKPLECNIVLQQICPLRTLTDHVLLASDAAVYSGIQDALKHEQVVLDCALIL